MVHSWTELEIEMNNEERLKEKFFFFFNKIDTTSWLCSMLGGENL